MTKGFARREREALADALLEAGPDAPTLCAGWAARDLAAHIVLRERRPFAAAGIIVKSLAGRTRRLQDRLAARDFAELIAMMRNPPAWSPVSNPLVHEKANQVEMFVHHEDVRRAASEWSPRELPPADAAVVWGQLGRVSRFALRKVPADVVVRAAGHGERRAGAGPKPGADPATVTIEGDPGELLLFLTGRQQVARVTVDGPEEIVSRLRQARLGI